MTETTMEKGMTGVAAPSLLSGVWVVVVLAALGAMAIVTAVLVAWPALAYIAARFF